MKNIIPKVLIICLALISLGTSTELPPDKYTVIKVEGLITYLSTGIKMNRGDHFNSNQKLQFKGAGSRAAVISKSKGRFVLTPKKSGPTKSNLLPAMSNISSRKGEILNTIDLHNYFKDNLLLLGKSAVKVKVKEYPLTKDNFFYLTYQHNGESIAKKLEFEGNDILLERASIFTVDEQPIAVPASIQVTLYHRDETKKESAKISEFNLVLPSEEDLKEELKIIQSESKDDEFSSSAQAYLAQFYGKIDADELKIWLSANSFLNVDLPNKK
jgi:hypothetical protein